MRNGFLRLEVNMYSQKIELSRAVLDLVYRAYHARLAWGNLTKVIDFNLGNLSNRITEVLMANKKSVSGQDTRKPEFTSVKWVNRQLTADEKEQHDSGNTSPQKAFKDLLNLAVQGYNCSLKWDAYSSCFQATLIPYATASVNYGYGLSARAADPYRALSLLLFKHYEILQEDWQQAYKPVGNSLEG
jgi:hypothetical protein